ncbi:MAG: LytR C-terminal domain-containing protein [Patescibacteria group bacterium]
MENRLHQPGNHRGIQARSVSRFWTLLRIGRWLSLSLVGLVLGVVIIFLIGPGLGYELMQNKSQVSTLVFPLITNQSQANLLIVQAGHNLESTRVWVIDGALDVKVPGGYGQYQLGAVWPLLELDAKDEAYQRAVLSFVLRQPIAQVLPIKTQGDLIGWPLLLEVLKVGLTDPSYSSYERWLLLKTSLILRANLPTQITKINHLDELMTTVRSDPPAFANWADECGIAVMNATELGGLANQYGQILESNGAYVVRVDDAGQTLEKSFVILDTRHFDTCLPVSHLLSQLLPMKIDITRASDVYQTYRTPVVVLLGQDVEKFLEAY